MASSVLLDRTLHLVRNRPASLTYAAIAEALDVSKAWIEALASGRIPDPGVCKVEALYNYLAATPLKIGDE